MNQLVTLHVPVKSYLKKYLTSKYGTEHCVSRRSWLGKYLVNLLDKQYRKSKEHIPGVDYYTIGIPSSIVKDVGFDINGLKLKDLSDMIHKVFLNDLYSYIEVSVGSGLKFINHDHDSINKQNVVRAISQFLKYYDIHEDEISTDTIYKGFYRDRTKENTSDSFRKTFFCPKIKMKWQI